MTPDPARQTLMLGGLAALVMALLVSLLLPSCCKPGDSSGFCKAEASLETCAKADAPAALQDVVNAALETVAGDWLSAVEKLALSFGAPAVDCAVKAAEAAYAAPEHDGGAARISADSMVRAKAHARARIWLARKATK